MNIFNKDGFIWFIGVVESRTDDPLKAGRCRVRIYGYHSVTGEYKEWDSQADCAEYVEGDRKNNNGSKFSLDSARNAKIHCKKWHLCLW